MKGEKNEKKVAHPTAVHRHFDLTKVGNISLASKVIVP